MNERVRLHMDDELIKRLYIEDELSTYDIEEKTGYPYYIVRERLRKMGFLRSTRGAMTEKHKENISLARLGKRKPKISEVKKGKCLVETDNELIKKLHIDDELSTYEIEEVTGYPYYIVRERLRTMGVLRTRGEAMSVRIKHTPGQYKGEANPAFGRHHTKEAKEKISKRLIAAWERLSPTEREEWLKKNLLSQKKPTSIEASIIALCKNQFPDFNYNGDYRLGITIGGMIPDFVNTNGKKQLIEVFGDTWHDEKKMKKFFNETISWKRTEFGRKAAYAQLGYKCLVLWEGEIKNMTENEIAERIKTFTEGGSD